MTDARLKGEWLTAAAHDALTDAAYRVLHNALMHCAEQGTDGALATRELRFLYPGQLDPRVLDEIEAAGFWERTPLGFQFIGWTTTLGQSSAEEIEEYRRKGRERQQRRRDRLKTTQDTTGTPSPLRSGGLTRDESRDVTRDITGDVGKDRTGPERPVLAMKQNARATRNAHNCERDGHRLTADLTTCIRCDFRDRDRIDQLNTGRIA